MESGNLMPSAGKGRVEGESSECHSQVETEQGPLLAPGMTQCPAPTEGTISAQQTEQWLPKTGVWSTEAKVRKNALGRVVGAPGQGN